MLTLAAETGGTYVRGLIAHNETVVAEDLGVDRGTLGPEGYRTDSVVRCMAEAARRGGKTTYALATLSGPPPEGTAADRLPDTLLVALAGPDGTQTRQLPAPGTRDQARSMAAMAAMDLLRRTLLHSPFDGLTQGAVVHPSTSGTSAPPTRSDHLPEPGQQGRLA